MVTVACEASVGSATLASGSSGVVLAVEVQAALHVPVNSCRLMLHGVAELEAETGDPVSVRLGYDDALETVFTGAVASVGRGFDTVEVEAFGAFTALVGARLNLLYEQETAGGIVSDVLGRLQVTEGTIEDGLKFPTFALDDGAFVWTHLDGLARRCGFDFWADEQDQARFQAYDPATTHTFSYGVDILRHELDARPAPVDGVEVYGSSPAGQGQGDDATSWPTKKEVKGSAGESTGRVLRVVDPAARTQKLAGDVATGVMAGYKRKAQGRLSVLGAPAVRLGDAVKLEKLPQSAHDGEARVLAVRHRLARGLGFVTDLEVERS